MWLITLFLTLTFSGFCLISGKVLLDTVTSFNDQEELVMGILMLSFSVASFIASIYWIGAHTGT